MKVEFPNLRHLRAFREVGQRNGISAAAEAVFMSQPAVTQAISGLEARLGEPLFERGSDGVFLTDAGEVFHARVTKLFHLLQDGATAAAEAAQRRIDQPQTGFETRVTAAQLRALIAVQDAGNFSLAAGLVGVTQPSLHRAARDLEKVAGISFFTARRRGITLSEAGESFARAVRLAWVEIQQGYDELSARRGHDVTRIIIGSMPLSRSAILPDAEHAMLSENAGVQLHNVDGPYWELLRGLRHGEIDLLVGALRNPLQADDVEQETLFHDPLALVVGPNHPLTKQRNVSIRDTLEYPWIAPPITTPAGSYLFRILKINELPQTPVRIVSSSMVMVRGLLMRGDYVTIMSRSQIRLEQENGLMIPLETDLPDSGRPIGLTTRKGWTPTPTQARFLELIRSAAHSTIDKTNSSSIH